MNLSNTLTRLIAVCSMCIAQATGSGSITLVLDDLGNQLSAGKAAIDANFVTTVAVMPGRPYSEELAHYAHQNNIEVIVHAPMSNTIDFPLGAFGLDKRDGRKAIEKNLHSAIASVPHAVGLSNHMGSQLTQDREAMNWVMAALKPYQFYFFDSHTVANSVAWQAAAEYRIPWAKRQVFLDHQKDKAFLNKQWRLAVKKARQGQDVRVICHPYPETVAFLNQLSLDDLEGIRLLPLSAKLNYPVTRLPDRNMPEGT